jgi:hypothetical protein
MFVAVDDKDDDAVDDGVVDDDNDAVDVGFDDREKKDGMNDEVILLLTLVCDCPSSSLVLLLVLLTVIQTVKST